MKLITKVFFPSQEEEEKGTEPAGAPKYRTAEMLLYPDFTLPASSTVAGGGGANIVLNELHVGSDVSVGNPSAFNLR